MAKFQLFKVSAVEKVPVRATLFSALLTLPYMAALFRCQFHQYFTDTFFCRKVLRRAFVLAFRFELFLALEYWRKCAHKLLVKLILGR
jgi:hypothetical protein